MSVLLATSRDVLNCRSETQDVTIERVVVSVMFAAMLSNADAGGARGKCAVRIREWLGEWKELNCRTARVLSIILLVGLWSVSTPTLSRIFCGGARARRCSSASKPPFASWSQSSRQAQTSAFPTATTESCCDAPRAEVAAVPGYRYRYGQVAPGAAAAAIAATT